MMFFSTRRWLGFALAVSAVFALLLNNSGVNRANAQNAPQGAPPILGVNDPQNTFHLTAQQQVEATAIKTKFQQDANAIMQNTSIPGNQKQGKIEALQVSSKTALQALLTPSQLALLKELTGKQDQIVALEVKANAVLESLTSSFTPAQKAKLTKIRQDAEAKANAIATSQASEQVKGDEINTLRVQFQTQTAAILNLPNQIALIKQIKKLKAQATVLSSELPQPPPQQPQQGN